jgi:release factor glutamine methyltransferase
MIRQAGAYLNDGGWLILEIGFDQKDAVSALLVQSGHYDAVRFTKDYAGIDRVVAARRGLKDGG